MIEVVLNGWGEHIRHALKDVGLLIAVVDALDVGRVVGGAVLLVGLDGEGLVFIEAFDGLGVGLDELVTSMRSVLNWRNASLPARPCRSSPTGP